jgi:hypothetical protein
MLGERLRVLRVDYVRSAPHLYAARVLKEPTGVCPETEGSITRWLVDADLFYSLLEPHSTMQPPRGISISLSLSSIRSISDN